MALWIFTLLIASALGLFETSEYVQEILSRETLQKEAENPDFLTFVLVYTSDSPKSRLLIDPITTISVRFHDYMRFFAYDCAYDPKTCSPEIKESLPMISAYVPGGMNPYTGKPLVYQRNYEGSGSPDELGSFLRKNTPYLGTYLTTENLEGFLADTLNKVILFTNKDSTPILYKGLTSHFRGRLEFGLVWANQTSVLRKFDVESFPTLLVQDEEGQRVYDGEMEFENIAVYLESYAAKKKQPIVYKNFNKKEEKTTEETVVTDTQKADVLKLTHSNFQKKLEKDEKLAVVMFYKDKMWQDWEDLSNTYGGILMLGTYKVEKQKDEEFAKELGVRSYPSIKMFPVNRKRKPIEVDSLDDLYELVIREIKFEIIPVADNTLQSYLNAIYEEDKVGCIYFSNTEIPISIKGLAADPKFKEQIKFGYYSSNNSNILNTLNVHRYPSLVCYVVTDESLNMQLAEYPGDLSSYPTLVYFIDEQFLPQFNRSTKKISEEDLELEWVDEFHAKNFHNLCEKKGGICVISFLEGHAEDEKNRAQVEILKKVKAEMEMKKFPLRFGWVDGVCEHELRASFNIQETALPNLAVYVPGKKK